LQAASASVGATNRPPSLPLPRYKKESPSVSNRNSPGPQSPEKLKLSRRTVLTGASAAASVVGLAAFGTLHSSSAKQPQSGTSPATPNPIGSPIPQEVTQYANDWPVVQGNLQSTRAAANSPINASNLNTLTQLWSVPITATGGFGGITATPVVIGDTIYLQDMQSNVFALDRNTGKEIWRQDYNVPNNGPDGVAVAYGYVFAATGDTSTAFALDQKTGAKVWEAKLSNNDFECIDMAPLVYGNTVYISTNPNNVTNGNYRGGARGILYALDALTGRTLWSFDTATDNLGDRPGSIRARGCGIRRPWTMRATSISGREIRRRIRAIPITRAAPAVQARTTTRIRWFRSPRRPVRSAGTSTRIRTICMTTISSRVPCWRR